MKTNFNVKLKIIARLIFYFIKTRFLNRNKDWIMGRIACMGQDVFKQLNIDVKVLNIQKGRVDYLNSFSENSKFRARAHKVYYYIKSNDIKSLIFQQQFGYGIKKKPPLMLYMDSFSELTDKRFFYVNKKWSFCANYSDINHSLEFKRKFKSEGFLHEDNLFEQYHQFFSFFRNVYSNVPVIFLHFPVKLDNREKFKIRYLKIKEAIDKIKDEFRPFYSLEVDESIVDWPEDSPPELKDFPYHYNKETYQNLANQIRSAGVIELINKKINEDLRR